MNRQVQIQSVQDPDLVWNLIAPLIHPGQFNWSKPKLVDELKHAIAKGLYLDNKLVAAVIFRELPGTNEITLLACEQSQQKKGWTQLLLKKLIDAYGQGTSWWLEVHEKNVAALKLYFAVGFTIDGRRHNYYPDRGTAILLSLKRKRLGDPT